MQAASHVSLAVGGGGGPFGAPLAGIELSSQVVLEPDGLDDARDVSVDVLGNRRHQQGP